jgi:serine/threonine protein phosphatase 1
LALGYLHPSVCGATPAPTGLLPPGVRVYAIGDVHGRHDLLITLQEAIVTEAARQAAGRQVVVFLGDYLSRGPDSFGVIENLRQWRPAGLEIRLLRGNHEDLALRFVDGDIAGGRQWFERGGGLATLASYGVPVAGRFTGSDASVDSLRRDFRTALPDAHKAFFTGLAISHVEGGYRFVHAGVAPGVPLEMQSRHDQLWTRQAFLSSDEDFGAVIVHGHSIDAQPQFRHNRIGIDTGAYHSGILTCLVIDAGGYALLGP